jgi:hypothetical protein
MLLSRLHVVFAYLLDVSWSDIGRWTFLMLLAGML